MVVHTSSTCGPETDNECFVVACNRAKAHVCDDICEPTGGSRFDRGLHARGEATLKSPGVAAVLGSGNILATSELVLGTRRFHTLLD